MKNTLLLLCEGTSIDAETRQWSLFNHIENFNVKEPEEENVTIRGKFTAVSFWNKEDGDENKFFEIKHQLVDGQENSLLDHKPIDVEVKKSSKTFKQRFKTSKIPFKGEGVYFLRALIREKGDKEFTEAAKIPIELRYD